MWIAQKKLSKMNTVLRVCNAVVRPMHTPLWQRDMDCAEERDEEVATQEMRLDTVQRNNI